MAIDVNTDFHSANVAKQARQKRAGKTRNNNAVPLVSVARSDLKYGQFDLEARHEMIAEAAYYLASQRGFAPDHELDDWLAAEKEVDTRLYGETHAF